MSAGHRLSERAVVALLCAGLCGCVSVPLSTMLRMATFDERDFVALDPEAIRARIKLLDGFALDPSRSTLGVKLDSKVGEHSGEFRLEQATQLRVDISRGLLASDVSGTEYTLKLSAASRDEFRKLQDFVGKGRPAEVLIIIKPILSAFPEDALTTRVWIDLQLERERGYFTLVEAAEVPMERIRAASTGG